MAGYRKAALVAAVFLAIFLSGCGLLDSLKKEEIDPPQTVTYTDDEEATTIEEMSEEESKEAGDEGEGTVKTELYLIDKNGYVVPRTFALPKKESVAKQALEYLVKDGPVTELLPNGFSAVLPPDTEMTVDIKDGTAIVDFNNEFKNYKEEDELKILQSVTWTLTQFDSIDNVKLMINGVELKEMPVGGTPIGNPLSRELGINHDTADVIDITGTEAATVYYIGGEEDSYYYVPVTKRVEEKTIENIVAELVKGPAHSSGLLTDFMPDVELNGDPVVEDGKVILDFNDSIYGSFEEKIISQHVLNMLALTLTEQEGIDSVAITVNGEAELVRESGEKLAEPVTRPENVNTGSF